jgi:hypothetical protein
VSPPSPHGFSVEGRPNSDLLRELQWYLETFLDYPFPPEIDHADRVLKALKDWGEQTFEALFDNRSAGRMLEAAGCPLRSFAKGGIRDIRGSHPSQKARRMGHPEIRCNAQNFHGGPVTGNPR